MGEGYPPSEELPLVTPAAEPSAETAERGRLRRPIEETAGTGSVLGIGCVLAVTVLVLILAVLFYLPFIR